MNRLTLLVLTVMLFVLTSCVDFDQNVVYGSGDIGDDIRDPGQVLGVTVNINCRVLIRYEDTVSLKLTGDKNILPLITTKTEGDKLVIDSTEAISFSKQLQVEIGIPQLSQVIAKENAEVLITKGSYGDNVELIMDGHGSIRMNESYFYLISTVINGSGHIDIIGDCSSLTGVINGIGYVYAKGRCDKLNITAASAGEVKMAELQSAFCTVVSTGTGNCYVRVSESITAILQNRGNVYLYGNPPTVNLTKTGQGDLMKMPE